MNHEGDIRLHPTKYKQLKRDAERLDWLIKRCRIDMGGACSEENRKTIDVAMKGGTE